MSGRYWHWYGPGYYKRVIFDNGEIHMYATDSGDDTEYVEDLPMDTEGEFGVFFEEEEMVK